MITTIVIIIGINVYPWETSIHHMTSCNGDAPCLEIENDGDNINLLIKPSLFSDIDIDDYYNNMVTAINLPTLKHQLFCCIKLQEKLFLQNIPKTLSTTSTCIR